MPSRLARVEREDAPVVRAEEEPAVGHGHVGAEAVVARLGVVERQPLDRLLDHPRPPALLPARGVERVEEAVVGLK